VMGTFESGARIEMGKGEVGEGRRLKGGGRFGKRLMEEGAVVSGGRWVRGSINEC